MEKKQAVKGTQDVLPGESFKWQYIEKTVLETAGLYGFSEIRTPVFEYTDLFLRSVGDTTDVVQKEMYTFEDKGGRSLTLRPEGTAGVVRSMIERGLLNQALPQKVCYLTACYRYEQPQAGRFREFHQFGAELFGSANPQADVEVILLAKSLLGAFGIDDVELRLNSIGCPDCRRTYQDALKKYFISYKEDLCKTCLDRLERNPMRILDCKSPACKEIAQGAPQVLDYICKGCSEHFDAVRQGLGALGIAYTIDPDIVRGLDYYTRTVFEFVSTKIGSQGTVCGGGRYDGLVEQLGGAKVPALGFGMGLERLKSVIDLMQDAYPAPPVTNVYIASMGDKAAAKAAGLAALLRAEGFAAQHDLMGRSLKAQMKFADKIGTKYVLVLGDSELESGAAQLKNMADGVAHEIKLDEICDAVYKINIDNALNALEESL